MSRSHHHHNRGGYWYNSPFLIGLDIILVILLAALFYLNHQQEVERQQKYQAIAEADKEQEKAVEAEIDSRAEMVSTVFSTYLPGIVCWGDSLTAGAGGDGTTYPLTLQSDIQSGVLDSYDIESLVSISHSKSREIDFSVVNMGVGGENTNTILGRNGAVPFVTAADFTIPADTTAVEITMVSANGKSVAPLRQGNRGMDYVTIDGVKGVISIEQETSTSEEYKYFFTRESAGDVVEIKTGTEIITSGALENLNYIPVIFIGQNGGYDDIADLISQQKAIIEHQNGNPVNEDGSVRFIIVGLHTGTAEERAELETAMEAEYGAQYINLREYMSTQGLADAGITATDEDKEMMAVGSTPKSLLVDGVHFTAEGYELIGNLIYNRMDELGYFDEVREAISEAMLPIEE